MEVSAHLNLKHQTQTRGERLSQTWGGGGCEEDKTVRTSTLRSRPAPPASHISGWLCTGACSGVPHLDSWPTIAILINF
jgi:hypothetical protein